MRTPTRIAAFQLLSATVTVSAASMTCGAAPLSLDDWHSPGSERAIFRCCGAGTNADCKIRDHGSAGWLLPATLGRECIYVQQPSEEQRESRWGCNCRTAKLYCVQRNSRVSNGRNDKPEHRRLWAGPEQNWQELGRIWRLPQPISPFLNAICGVWHFGILSTAFGAAFRESCARRVC
jgi:hypothetical protein